MTTIATPTFLNHYAENGDLEVLWGYLNGMPIYGRYGARGGIVTVTREWIEATQPNQSKATKAERT